jgi:hypothetical protein
VFLRPLRFRGGCGYMIIWNIPDVNIKSGNFQIYF